MNLWMILISVGGGIVMGGVLRASLYAYAPGMCVADWTPTGTASGLLLASIIAALCLVGVGAAAARMSGMGARRTAAGQGALAGMIAALLAEVWVGGAAAGVWGDCAMLNFGLRFTRDEAEFLQLLIEGVVGTYVWSYASIWLALALGLGLGAAGGALAGGGSKRRESASLFWPTLSVCGVLLGVLTIVVTIAIYPLLVQQTQRTAMQIGYTPAAPVGLLLTLPLATNFIVLLCWQWISYLALRRMHPESQKQHAALVSMAAVNGVLPWLMMIAIIVMGRGYPLHPLTVIGGLLTLVIGGLTLWRAWQMRRLPEFQTQGLGISPAQWSAIAGASGLTLGLVTYISSSGPSLNIVLLVIPFISVLATHDAAAQVALQTSSVQTVAGLVQSTYDIHQWYFLGTLGLSGVLMLLTLGGASLLAARKQPAPPEN